MQSKSHASTATDVASIIPNTAKVMKIVGHGDGHAIHWGYVCDLPELKPIVDNLGRPVDVQALRYDGRFVSFFANRNNWAPGKKPPAAATATKAEPRRKAKAD